MRASCKSVGGRFLALHDEREIIRNVLKLIIVQLGMHHGQEKLAQGGPESLNKPTIQHGRIGLSRICTHRSKLRHQHLQLTQDMTQLNHWHPHQSGLILPDHLFKQTDSQTFTLKTAGTH